MIYGNSNHPVFVKKIALKIWTLRDEIEAIVTQRARTEGLENVNVQDLIEEYKDKELVTEKPLHLVEESSQDDGEDEMMKAMQEAKEAEETQDLGEGQSDQEEPKTEIQKQVQVLRRVPDLPIDRIFHGKMLLAEIDMNNIYFFCETKFSEGQSIVIDFQIPMRFVVNANIMYCRPYNMKSRIISPKRLPYRVAAKFTFLKEGERTLLRNFISSIEPTIEEIAPIKKVAAPEASEDFDELDEFDL